MDATAFVMKIYGIQDKFRAEVEDTFANTRAETLDLAFRMMGQHPDDDDFDNELDEFQSRLLA